MNLFVCGQVSLLTESLPAFRTFIRFLVGVGLHVRNEVGAASKTFLAYGALVGLLSRMNSFMGRKIALLAEAFATL